MEIENERKCRPGLVMVILIRSHISGPMVNRIAYTVQSTKREVESKLIQPYTSRTV
jgi:hypothetical protein